MVEDARQRKFLDKNGKAIVTNVLPSAFSIITASYV